MFTNLFGRKIGVNKLVIIATAIVLSFFAIVPVEARKTNPRPSIFKEFPYNRSVKRRAIKRPKVKLQRQPKQQLKKPVSVQNRRYLTHTKPTETRRDGTRVVEFRAPR
jgi:hypothetical protein